VKILVSYRAIPQSPGWATGDMVVKAFRHLGHETFAYAKYYQENRWLENPTATPSEYDLCLFLECNDGDPQYCELKNIRARKTACWLFDNSYYKDHLRGLIDYFNFNFKFLANPLVIKELQESGYSNIHYLPYACDPELHKRSVYKVKYIDVALIGSIREDRIKLADELKKYNIELQLIGGLYRSAYIDALASSKIIINQNPPSGRGLLNMRFWETIAAGSWIITEAEDANANVEIRHSCLNIHNLYHNTEELAKICSMFMKDEHKRLQHTESMQDHILRYHTYSDRCQEILQTVFPDES
jgi:spore maturation protein CgeB